jgi:hypothetical protein
MTTTALTRAHRTVPVFRVPEPADWAALIRSEALARARQKTGRALPGDLAGWLRRPDFFEYFAHALAFAVARALAATDESVLAVYACHPDGDTTPEATLHLLVRVSAPSAALADFVVDLDRALTASLRELPSPRFARRTFTLDVSLVSEDDIRLGLGQARLLSAVFSPPLKLV